MFEHYVILTGVVIGVMAFVGYWRTRDAFHPAVLTSPLFLYMYCVWPLLLNRDGALLRFFPPEQLGLVSLLGFICIAALYLGFLRTYPDDTKTGTSLHVFSLTIDEQTRKRIAGLSVFLGLVAVAAYLYKIGNVGGFESAYGRAKGGGWAGSGYISESVLFSFPAVLLYAISRKVREVTALDVVLAITMMMPHLLQGTLGGRRGPIFLALATLFVAWFIAKRRTPKMRTAIIGIGLCGLAVLFVWSQRQDVYLGSGGEFDIQRVWAKIVPEEEVSPGNTYVVGAATILMAKQLDHSYWGYRYFVTFFIRPIPKQIWPTKYEDAGADWLLRYGEDLRNQRYFNTVGFVPYAGSAYGYVADLFLEFSWMAILASYMLGRAFNMAWRKHTNTGQFWSVLYLLMVVLSIYLVTQSVTAWAHRLFFIGGMTLVLWKYWIGTSAGLIRAAER